MPISVCELKNGKPVEWMSPGSFDTTEEWKKRLAACGTLARAKEMDFKDDSGEQAWAFKATSARDGVRYFAIQGVPDPGPK